MLEVWFKLGMDKLVDVTGSCQTHRHHTWHKVLEPWKRAWEKHHISLLSTSTFPSSLALGSWPSTPLTWPGLLCLYLGRVLFLLRSQSFPWHPAPGLLMASQLLFSHPSPRWWTHPGCSSCIYFQSRQKEQFPNRSVYFVFLLSHYVLDKRAGNSWGAAGISTPLKVCYKCLDSQNEPVWKGNTMRSPACTAPGNWVQSLQTDHRSEM